MVVDLESVSEATSGAIGSLLSTTILYPLDTCKSKFQAEVRAQGRQQKYRHLSDVLWEAVSKGQVLSLYQGLGTKNLQSFVSQFIYFYSYSYFKRLHSERTGSKSIGTKANLIIAAAAGACTSVLTQAYTASSRMQTSEFGESKGLWKTLTGGAWGDAFDGLGISLLLTSNPAIQYTVFDQLKQRLLKQNTAKAENGSSSPVVLSAFMAFLLGAVSKSVATVITYPAIRCKVMIQAAGDSKEDKTKKPIRRRGKTIPGVVYAIWRKEGMLGFFKGLHAQILKTVLSSALLLMIKEKISATTWILILAIRRTLFLTKGKLKSP
ncbi:unnamed protein product [Eruca vesicaria subsp. sativa]|uniref:Peroxisomal adenine nucleotide carrier 1 n=1 Tax=Eruca vesicaria subsp. sativa TaxID=29727 RepID=A0ABC8KSX8_ERUVS|nr:unnamed protein product [Eruca vesicaria subsp. sativa]